MDGKIVPDLDKFPKISEAVIRAEKEFRVLISEEMSHWAITSSHKTEI